MSFEVIADETRLPVNEVEHLVMKALRWVFFLFWLLFVPASGPMRHNLCDLVGALRRWRLLASSSFLALPPLFAFIFHPIQPNPI